LKLSGTHQILVDSDVVNILGESVHTIKKTLEALAFSIEETGIEVNADKTKQMVTSRDQDLGRNHSVDIDNSSFERAEEFKYLGTTLTNQNSLQEEIMSRLHSKNASYHLVRKSMSASLLSKNIKIKMYRTIVLSVVCMSVKPGQIFKIKSS